MTLPTREEAAEAVSVANRQSVSINAARQVRKLIALGTARADGVLLTAAEWRDTIDYEAAAIRLWYRDNPQGGKFRDATNPEQQWTRYDAKEIVNIALGDKPAVGAAVGEVDDD